MNEGKTCLKCGYTRVEGDPPPYFQCPGCAAVYDKVEQHLDREQLAEQLAKKKKPATIGRVVRAIKRTPEMMRAEKSALIKTYRGRRSAAYRDFREDALKLELEGFKPDSEVWDEGTYGPAGFAGGFLLMTVLFFVFMPAAIFILLYMLIVKPKGTLTITYRREHQESQASPA